MSSNLFNEQWYLNRQPDVAAAVEEGWFDAWTHFDLYGRHEGRSFSPTFDTAFYLSQNPDVARAVEDGQTTAYDHFVNHGIGEQRSFVAYFDPQFYVQQNPDIAAAVDAGWFTPTEHFLLHGSTEPRVISPFFDLLSYINANPDVAAAVEANQVDPLGHLLTYGVSEGRPLGNGVSLSQFANDPTFQQAIVGDGDPFTALARVAEVTPFLSNFEPPAGWQPPADTPIPVDFVPVGDEKLVVPPTVEVPDDVELPDTFEPGEPEEPGEPVDPGGPGEPEDPGVPTEDVTTVIGETVSEVATQPDTNYLWVGSSNSNDNFSITTTQTSQIELALKGYVRGLGDTEDVSESQPNYRFDATDRAGFAYSLAALGGATLQEKLSDYSFYLNIDIDRGVGEHFVTFKLEAETTFTNSDKPNDSGYQWVRVDDPDVVISDDEGGEGAATAESYAAVTQNIQTPIWYGEDLEGENAGSLRSGDYTVTLQVFWGQDIVVENLIAEQAITLDVAPLEIETGRLSDFATKENGDMFVGSGVPGSSFVLDQITLDPPEGINAADVSYLEIALGASNRGSGEYEMAEDGIIFVPEGDIPVFKFSVATDSVSLVTLLNDYDIRLSVDMDPTAGTDFIVMDAVANTNDSSGALDWQFMGDFSEYRLTDDAGTPNVSQNIQALGWYQPDESGALFSSVESNTGSYTVALEVYEKGSIQLVGATEMELVVQ